MIIDSKESTAGHHHTKTQCLTKPNDSVCKTTDGIPRRTLLGLAAPSVRALLTAEDRPEGPATIYELSKSGIDATGYPPSTETAPEEQEISSSRRVATSGLP